MGDLAKWLVVGVLGLYGLQSCQGDPVTGAKIATGGAAVGAGVGAGIGAGAAGAGLASGVKRGMHDRARDWVARPDGPSRPGPVTTLPLVDVEVHP